MNEWKTGEYGIQIVGGIYRLLSKIKIKLLSLEWSVKVIKFTWKKQIIYSDTWGKIALNWHKWK